MTHRSDDATSEPEARSRARARRNLRSRAVRWACGILALSAATAGFPRAALARPPLPKVPAGGESLVKPATIIWTATPSGIYGGPTGKTVEGPSAAAFGAADLGSLKWTTYTAQTATAVGVDWEENHPNVPPYRLFGTVRITVSRPVHGAFTRMVVVEQFNAHAGAERNTTQTFSFSVHKHAEWIY